MSGTVSNESPVKNTKDLVLNTSLAMEMVVQGAPVVMYMSHDLYENTKVMTPSQSIPRQYQNAQPLLLVDDRGNEHPVYRDNKGNNHMLLTKELCHLPLLKELNQLGVQCFRIEGCHYDAKTLRYVIKTYQNALENLDECHEIFKSFDYEKIGFTLGALQYN